MKFYTLLILALLTFPVTGQQVTDSTNTVDNQFNTLYKKSGSYQIYKVILKSAYRELQSDVVDSINVLNETITERNTTISNQQNTLAALEKTSNTTETKLKASLAKENSISLLGFEMSKQSYSFLLFSIIIILIGLLIYYIYKFNNSNKLTTKAKYDLEDVELEFTIFRKKSIAREQKIRRELQDIIIKNRES